MLARHLALKLSCLFIHFIHGKIKLFKPLLFAQSVFQNVNMKVSVACVTEAFYSCTCLFLQCVRKFNHFVNRISRHNHVNLVHIGGGVFDSLQKCSPRLPYRFVTLLGVRNKYVCGAVFKADFSGVVIVIFNLFLAASVKFQKKIGVGGRIGKFASQIAFGVLDNLFLHKFNRRWNTLCLYNLGNSVYSLRNVFKRNKQTYRFFRQRQKLKGCLCDNSERAFAAHNKVFKVVARAVFNDFSAEVNNFSVWQNNLKMAHIISCNTVFNRTHTACVGAYVSADCCGFFARVGRIEKFSFLNVFCKFHQKNARLNRDCKVFFVKLKNVVHLRQIKNNSAPYRHARTHKPRSAAPYRKGNFVFVSITCDFCNLLGAKRLYHNVGRRMSVSQLVVRIFLVYVFLIQNPLAIVNDFFYVKIIFFVKFRHFICPPQCV